MLSNSVGHRWRVTGPIGSLAFVGLPAFFFGIAATLAPGQSIALGVVVAGLILFFCVVVTLQTARSMPTLWLGAKLGFLAGGLGILGALTPGLLEIGGRDLSTQSDADWSTWMLLPVFGMWGVVGALFGMLVAVLASALRSIGQSRNGEDPRMASRKERPTS